MHDLVIEGAKALIFQNGQIKELDVNVAVKNAKISEISTSMLEGLKKIKAGGLHLLPGVIDSQVHFRDPGMTHKEDIESGTRAAVLGGVTSIFEMPNTVPATTTKELFLEKIKRAEGTAWCNFAFFIGGSPENVDKLAELEKLHGCSGIKVFMGSSTGTLLVEDDPTLEKIFRSGTRRVILHSEDEPRLRERKHIALESKDVHNHPVWRDVGTAVRSTERLLALAEKTKRPVHVLHISSAEEIEILRKWKKEKRSDISVEVLPNHLTLFAPDCYDQLGTLAQQNPPIREKRHQEGLWQGLVDGTIDVIGSDHAPHTLEEKKQEYPKSPSGTPGVQTLVPIMLDHVHNKKLSLARFVEMVGENPRKVFGCFKKGRIEVGLDADFTLVDLKKEKLIENKWITSKSAWSPFDGKKVTGWPVMTIVNGHIVMENDQLLEKNKGQKVEFNS